MREEERRGGEKERKRELLKTLIKESLKFVSLLNYEPRTI